MKKYTYFLAILLASFALLTPAFYNGFPFVYSDTGTYIASGFEAKVPSDRPILYGLFLRHSSLSDSLWLTVFSQALLACILLFYLCLKIFEEKAVKVFSLLILVLLGTTSLPWFASFLMADFFSGIAFLLLFILIFIPPITLWFHTLAILLYWFSCGTHLTNAPAHLFVMAIVWFTRFIFPWMKERISSNQIQKLFLVVTLNFLFLPTIHFIMGGGFTSSKAGQLFLLGRNVENGLLKHYLTTTPQAAKFKLYPYKDSLPESSPEFLWSPNSPLNKIGPWENSLLEIEQINSSIWRQWECFTLFFKYYFKVVFESLKQHQVGEEFIPFNENTPPGWEISFHFKKELNRFLSADQAKGAWVNKMEGINLICEGTLLVSFIIIVLGLVFTTISPKLKLLTIFFLLYYLGNILAVSIASSGSRYFARIDWLFALIAIFIIFSWIQNQCSKLGQKKS